MALTFRVYIRFCPARRTRTKSACFSIFKWCDKVAPLTSMCSLISATDCSPDFKTSSIFLRWVSAIAWNKVCWLSSCMYLDYHRNIYLASFIVNMSWLWHPCLIYQLINTVAVQGGGKPRSYGGLYFVWGLVDTLFYCSCDPCGSLIVLSVNKCCFGVRRGQAPQLRWFYVGWCFLHDSFALFWL